MRKCLPLLVLLLHVAGASAETAPTGREIHWGKQPVEELTSRRGRICLNGLWQFAPARNDAETKPPQSNTAYGWIPVPGSWKYAHGLGGLIEQGKGNPWQNVKLHPLARAWYRRRVTVPAEWKGRKVRLRLDRVSTDARVFVDGKPAGRVNWPFGSVDISAHVKPGGKHVVDILVVAYDDPSQADRSLVNPAASDASSEDELDSRGIVGEVFLESLPQGARVKDIFVKTAVKNKQLGVEVEFTEIDEAKLLKLSATIEDPDGTVVKTFTAGAVVDRGPAPFVSKQWYWADPKLWRPGSPHLYTLKLRITGGGIDDEISQVFGFRDFAIDGKNFLLNGKPIRLRPIHCHDEKPIAGQVELIDAAIDGMRSNGFNFQELWPWDEDKRGTVHFRRLWAERADRKGWLISGNALSMRPYLRGGSDGPAWSDPKVRDRYRARMKTFLRRYRNHPSIVMWATTANTFGHHNDQSPRVIGTRGWVESDDWKKRAAAGMDGVKMIKAADPTRPVFTHHGAYVGDVHTINMYLNLLPLQERAEWLSEYARTGTMPLMPVEFGTPLIATFMRGRSHYGQSQQSEPLATEFAAMVLGPDAYKLETTQYRKEIAARHIAGMTYKSWHDSQILATLPSVQRVIGRYNARTWPAWRTWGIPGGMIPWSYGHGWDRFSRQNQTVKMPPFKPGRRGSYRSDVPASLAYYMQPKGMEIRRAGEALQRNNQPTLAWIAGQAGGHTSVAHNYLAGRTMRKQIVLINDSRQSQPYKYVWTAEVGGKRVGGAEESGTIKSMQTLKLPIKLDLPEQPAGDKVDAKITLKATIGRAEHSDELAFRVFRKLPEIDATVAVFDPYAGSSAMLSYAGISRRSWNGRAAPGVLVIGRNAVSGGHRPPGDVKKFVSSGGTCVMFIQDRKWLRENIGFRIGPHVHRQAFAIDTDHPAVEGLDNTDLSYWTGSSTLIDGYPHYEGDGYPEHGWHWGNRHGVTSAALEKPHRAGWRPILECGFDLAWSPLMELDYGKGRFILSTLDLGDHYAKDPAAVRMVRNIILYAIRSKPRPRAESVIYIGGRSGRETLEKLGVRFDTPAEPDLSAASQTLLIVGSGAKPDAERLTEFLRRGGRALVLGSDEPNGLLGVKRRNQPRHTGSLSVPDWPEAAGLSASDLRWRAAHPAFVISGGADVASDGLLARRKIGKGVIVFCQIDPDRFHCGKQPYFRYTRWRQTRALSQILANLGAAFEEDGRIFRFFDSSQAKPDAMSLAGNWKVKLTWSKKEVDKNLPDPGISKAARNLLQPDASEAGMDDVKLPAYWGGFSGSDGEAVFRRTVTVPEDWAGKDLVVHLGPIDDFDATYFNGQQIGKTDMTNTPVPVSNSRTYRIPGRLVKAGKNVIAIRVFDHRAGGGFRGKADDMQLIRPKPGFYHPDYRHDHANGDDPYRYHRW